MLELLIIAAQKIDSNQGTAQALQGAQQRISEPHMYDMVFPVIALVLVIILPSCIALWAAYKTIVDTTLKDGEA